MATHFYKLFFGLVITLLFPASSRAQEFNLLSPGGPVTPRVCVTSNKNVPLTGTFTGVAATYGDPANPNSKYNCKISLQFKQTDKSLIISNETSSCFASQHLIRSLTFDHVSKPEDARYGTVSYNGAAVGLLGYSGPSGLWSLVVNLLWEPVTEESDPKIARAFEFYHGVICPGQADAGRRMIFYAYAVAEADAQQNILWKQERYAELYLKEPTN